MELSGSDLPVSGRERFRELNRGRSPDHWPQKMDQNRRLDSHSTLSQQADYYPGEGDPSRVSEHPKSEQNRGKNEGRTRRQTPEHYFSEGRTKYPEEYPPARNRNAEADPRHNQDLAYRDDPSDRDRTRRKDRDQQREREKRRKGDTEKYRDKSQDKVTRDPGRDRLRPKDVDMGQNGYRHRSRDRDLDLDLDKHGHKERARDGERNRSRDRNRSRELDGQFPSKRSSEETEDNAVCTNRQRHYSSDDVFEEPSSRSLSKGQTPRYRGMHKGPCVSVCGASLLALAG